ncbi:MAG: hypothetical protein ACLQJ7_11330 [Syntrophobacteraceae bacterium]
MLKSDVFAELVDLTLIGFNGPERDGYVRNTAPPAATLEAAKIISREHKMLLGMGSSLVKWI